jgi:hypothetical protein
MPVFVRADREAGCTWGRVIHVVGTGIFALTPAGVRFYGVPSENELLVHGEDGYGTVYESWQRALATLP